MRLTVDSGVQGRKTRSFSGELLGYLCADRLWEGGAANTRAKRPVWAQIATPTDATGPLLANLRLGRKAIGGRDDEFEWLKSAPYAYSTQKTPAGALTTIYLPHLFRADPGVMHPRRVAFVLLPSQAWIERQTAALGEREIGAAIEHAASLTTPEEFGIYPDWQEKSGKVEAAKLRAVLRSMVAYAPLFALFLDRRTRCPIVPDLRFQLQILAAAFVRQSFAQSTLEAFGGQNRAIDRTYRDCTGYAAAWTFSATHEAVDEFLARETATYFETITEKPAALAASRSR